MASENIDIDSLLGAIPKVNDTPQPVVDTGVDSLLSRLSVWSEGCRDVPVDLRQLSFKSDDGSMWLELPEGHVLRRIDFKRDPANPKDPKILHSQKQLCRVLGIPHGFFMNNRPSLRESMVRTWQSGLETDDKRSKCVARIREGGNIVMLRALLPERAVPPRVQDIIGTVNTCFGKSVRVAFSHGDDRDDLMLHARFLLGDKIVTKDGKNLCIGFDIVFSELGACPMTVDAILCDEEHSVTYVASYGGEPFFSSKYEGLQPKEVAEMFPGLLTRIRAEVPEMSDAIQSANDGVYSVKQDCVFITRGKGITAAMRKSVFHEVTQATDIVTRLDLARHVSLVAKDFDSLKGLALERAAGRYINLCFARSMPEAQKENTDVGSAGKTEDPVVG
jgi:hypothetical protein